MERGAGARLLLLLLLWAACCWHARAVGSSRYTITVTNGGPWGDWAWPEMCPDGLFTIGFSIKVEAPQGIPGDDTAMNGIRLYCSHGRTVESESGRWGAWSEPQWCPRGGFLVAFSLRVEAPKTLGDNTGANNVRFRCSDGTELEGPGLAWGDFGKWSEACPKGICGAQTKVQASRGLLDDTALNDVRFFCCSS